MPDQSVIHAFLAELGFGFDADLEQKLNAGMTSAIRRVESLENTTAAVGTSAAAKAAAFSKAARSIGRRAADFFVARLEQIHFATIPCRTAGEESMASVGTVHDASVPVGLARAASVLGVTARDAQRDRHTMADTADACDEAMAKLPASRVVWYARQLGASEDFIPDLRDPGLKASYDRGQDESQKNGVGTRSRGTDRSMGVLPALPSRFDEVAGVTEAFVTRTGSLLGRVGTVARRGGEAMQATIEQVFGAGIKTMPAPAAPSAAEAVTAHRAAEAGSAARTPDWTTSDHGPASSRDTRNRSITANTLNVPFAERIANSAFGRRVIRGASGHGSANHLVRDDYVAGIDHLVSVTLDRVIAAQCQNRLDAAGRYQNVRDTLVGLVRGLGSSSSGKFDRRWQERSLGAYLSEKKRNALDDFLPGERSGLHAALLTASREWLSMAHLGSGLSFDDSADRRRASVTALGLGNALFNSRSAHQPAPHWRDAVRQGRTNHVEVRNDVTIQVNGSKNPDAVARAVGREQQTFADNLIRNMQGALQ